MLGVIRLLHAYNQKVIETPTYKEIWEYEKPIQLKKETLNEEPKEYREELAWLYEEEEKDTKRDYDELAAYEQYDSLKRKQKHYRNMRFTIARLIDTNFDKQTKFLTLTFKENIHEIAYTNNEFNKFIKRLNYHIHHTKKALLKYIATWEKQKRGAIHYHIILFSFPYIPQNTLATIWGNGFIKINKIDVDSVENRGRYVSKYFDKDLDLKEHKQKAFFKSQNLKLPIENKLLTNTPYDVGTQKVLYSNEYILRTPVFFPDVDENGATDWNIEFSESVVKYTKIKK